MIKRLLSISAYSVWFIFVLAGVSLAVVGYATYNLLSLSMANLAFLREHGWTAIMSGGLLQLLELLLSGIVSLGFFVLYKICESELLTRYRHWQER